MMMVVHMHLGFSFEVGGALTYSMGARHRGRDRQDLCVLVVQWITAQSTNIFLFGFCL
jgi:hypothetical protein